MKDFYDVYYFLNNLKNEIDMNILNSLKEEINKFIVSFHKTYKELLLKE